MKENRAKEMLKLLARDAILSGDHVDFFADTVFSLSRQVYEELMMESAQKHLRQEEATKVSYLPGVE